MCHTFESIATLLYVQCSTPFPLPYLLSLKHYFVSVYISLLYSKAATYKRVKNESLSFFFSQSLTFTLSTYQHNVNR